ncbi:hypothetical protein G7046_g9075 [Stylonectria norvegica]|nr:hypothetical protein G7046_g9075 [Stylonectria norvegica]
MHSFEPNLHHYNTQYTMAPLSCSSTVLSQLVVTFALPIVALLMTSAVEWFITKDDTQIYRNYQLIRSSMLKVYAGCTIILILVGTLVWKDVLVGGECDAASQGILFSVCVFYGVAWFLLPVFGVFYLGLQKAAQGSWSKSKTSIDTGRIAWWDDKARTMC